MFEYMEDAETVSRELADIYAKASRQLNYRIDEIYDKFKDRHGLTDKEAMALLNTLKNKKRYSNAEASPGRKSKDGSGICGSFGQTGKPGLWCPH